MEQQPQKAASGPEPSAMDQQPQTAVPDSEASAVVVQPPQEPNAHPPRRRRLVLILSALAILLLVGASFGSYLVITRARGPHAPTTGARLTPTPTIPLAQRWHMVDSPTAGKDSTWLSGVAASSPTDAWAWGFTKTPPPGSLYTAMPLLLHWDGQSWQAVAAPLNQHIHPLEITSIAALAPDNAWLVDNVCEMLHWDGHQWSQTAPPAIPFGNCDLEAITALSATDIWAVGSHADCQGICDTSEKFQTLVLHWNGQQWSVVPAPNPGATRWLTQITALSPTNLWAIGGLRQTVPPGGIIIPQPGQPTPTPPPLVPTYTLIEHWDGQQWSVVPSPSPGTQDNTLSSVTALAPNDVWAVGQDGSTDVAEPNGQRTVIEQPLTMHWDGQQWSVVSSPTLPGSPQKSVLSAVAALGPDDIWAVGSITDRVVTTFPDVATPVQASQMLLEHWDGTQWSIVAVQAPGQGSALYGLARVPNTQQLWAVGGWSQFTDLTTPATTLAMLMV